MPSTCQKWKHSWISYWEPVINLSVSRLINYSDPSNDTPRKSFQDQQRKGPVRKCSTGWYFFKAFKKIFIWLCWGLSCRISQLWHVGSSSLIRDWTWAPCIGVQNLSHWTNREVPGWYFWGTTWPNALVVFSFVVENWFSSQCMKHCTAKQLLGP